MVIPTPVLTPGKELSSDLSVPSSYSVVEKSVICRMLQLRQSPNSQLESSPRAHNSQHMVPWQRLLDHDWGSVIRSYSLWEPHSKYGQVPDHSSRSDSEG